MRAGTVDDCVEAAREFCGGAGVELIHPFDDPAVIAGQGTIGFELLEEIEDLVRVVIPLGGGGLAGGSPRSWKGPARPRSRSSGSR